MEKLGFSLSVMAIGLMIVFVGLIVLIFATKIMSLIMKQGPKKAGSPAPVEAPKPQPQVVQSAPEEDLSADGQLIAVITAAIMAMEGGAKGLVIRSVKRSGANTWARAGRAEILGGR